MKKVFATAMIAAGFVMSAPAMAATEIELDPTGDVRFGDFRIVGSMVGNNQFAEFYFNVPAQGVVSASSTATISLPTMSGIRLTSIILNGVTALATLRDDGKAYEAAINGILTKDPNPQELRVNYDVMNAGRATGTVSWTSSAVPEPGTWALMILGFGVVGYSMRRRASVRFAQAI